MADMTRQFQRIAIDEETLPRDDTEQSLPPTPRSLRQRTPMLLAAGLGLAAVGACVAFWPSNTVQEQPSSLTTMVAENGDPRFLTSVELAQTAVKHALLFHDENGELLKHLSPKERTDLEDELLPQATAQALTLAHKIAATDAEAGRKLQALQLTPDQWAQTQTLLEALHDKRVQDMGKYMAQAIDQSGGDKDAVREKLGERHQELRNLAGDLIPAAVQDIPRLPNGHQQWEIAVNAKGQLEGKGQLGSWDSSFEVGERRLAATTLAAVVAAPATTAAPAPATNGPIGQLTYILWLTIGSSVAALMSIVFAILTGVLGPVAARILYTIYGSVSAAMCGTSMGVMWLPGMKHVGTWIPCMIMSSFTGLQAIWTFDK